MCDSILKTEILKAKKIPLTLTEDKLLVGKVAQPLSAIAGGCDVPTLFFRSEIAIATVNGSNRNDYAGIGADKASASGSSFFVKSLEYTLVNVKVCKRLRPVVFAVGFQPVDGCLI